LSGALLGFVLGYDIIEEGYKQMVKSRGIDAGHRFIQVVAVPFELEIQYERTERVRADFGFPTVTLYT
jgi:hypothetical protein